MLVLAACLLATGAQAAVGDKLSLSGYTQTFDSNFSADPNGSQPNPKRWATEYYFGRHIIGERESYEDSGSCPSRTPFWVGNGLLQITAFAADAWGLAHCLGNPGGKAPAAGASGAPTYISGLVTTQHSFSQTYGYFELDGWSPAEVPGEWPAFWLIPTVQTKANMGQCPEFDVMERWGGRAPAVPASRWSSIFQTLHECPLTTGGAEAAIGDGAKPPQVAPAGEHRYGLLWTPGKLAWFVDGVETFETPFANADPHYMIANLALDGRYPPPAGPVRFYVKWIKAWAPPAALAH